MYQVIAADRSLVTKVHDFEVALSLLRRIPRAQEVRCDDSGVLLAWKPHGSLLAMVGYGADAGAPRGVDAAYVAGASGWN